VRGAGYALAHVKLTSTWAEYCPAYYLALNLQEKEVVIAIRGTAQIEDVVTDLTALPAVCRPSSGPQHRNYQSQALQPHAILRSSAAGFLIHELREEAT
jgi:hypothetical protein